MIPVKRPLSRHIFYLKKIPETDHINIYHRLIIIKIVVRTGNIHSIRAPCVPVFKRQIFVLHMQGHPDRIFFFRFKPDKKTALFYCVTISFICKMSDRCIFHVFVPLSSLPAQYFTSFACIVLLYTL